MLNLSSKLTLNPAAVKATNLCSHFSAEDLDAIGAWVYNGYMLDKGSRSAWERRNEAGMDLAMQLQKDKNFPWAGCSNVAFPLITIAAMQFHARAYPTLVDAPDIVKARVIGSDPDGAKAERADRVSEHMSYQVLEEDQPWEEQHDKMLLNIPIVGTGFKKSYYSGAKSHNVSDFVLAKDLVLNYWAKSVEDCPRKTHLIPLYRNDVHERMARGQFRDIAEEAWYQQPASPPNNVSQTQRRDIRQGTTPPQSDETTPWTFLEQHVNLDLDGDGYDEPYIITVEENSKCCVRIVTRFDRWEDIEFAGTKVVTIRPMEYFTKYPFIPSPDGGIYDIGFGVLLGPLNESVNTAINQLFDAGTMSTAAGGFLGRGAKIRGGVYTFAPFGWNRVDSSGDDLRKNIFPLPVREPSTVLFQLLSLLINYTQRVSGSTDMMTGENPGQNTPAETSRSMIEQGSKIYNALFKRVWRSMKEEFKKLYILNAIYLPEKAPFGTDKWAYRQDYIGDPRSICPAADPNITSDGEALQQALAVKQAAATTAGYDPEAVEKFYLKRLKVEGIDTLYGGLKKFPPGQDAKVQVQEMKNKGEEAWIAMEKAKYAATLLEEQRVNSANIIMLQAQAEKLVSEIEGDGADKQIAMIDAMIGLANTRNEHIIAQVDMLLRSRELDLKDKELDIAKEKPVAA